MYAGKIPFPNPDGSTSQIDNKEFELSLKFFDVVTPSQKAPTRKRFILADKNGVKFTMLPQEFEELQRAAGIKFMTNYVTAGFTFVKRGKSFGLKLVRLEPVTAIMPVVTAAPAVTLPFTPMGLTAVPATQPSSPLPAHYANIPVTPAVTAPAAPTTPVTPAPVVKQRTSLFALCLDASGSMQSIRADVTVKAVNDMLASIAEEAKKNGQIAKAMLWEFGVESKEAGRYSFSDQMDGVKITIPLTEASQIKPMDVAAYHPRGNTPLFKCIGEAIEYFQSLPEYKDEDVSFFVHAITDGQENASRGRLTPAAVNAMMKTMQNTDRWTFAFQVPKGDESDFLRNYNVPAGNVQGWTPSTSGMTLASLSNNSAVGSYMSSRSLGVRAVKNVYTTDLSNVKLEDLKSKLNDVSHMVRFMKVEKEATIKEFAEEKTKQTYVTGSIYYQLTKTEDVQPYKFPEFLIRVKNTKQVYAGKEACKLVGIDPTNTDIVKVIPGNHSNYDIFVPSTSVNRKLVRGTETIYLPRAVPLRETWDSAAAKAAADLKKAQQGVTP